MPETIPIPPPRSLPPEQHEFLRAVYARFHRTGTWPDISLLQRQLAKAGSTLDLSKVARQLPSDLGYEDLGRSSGVLTVLGIRVIAPEAEEIQDFVLAMTRCVALYYGEEDEPLLTSADLTQEGLDQLRLNRLLLLLQREVYLTAGGSSYPDASWDLHVRDTARHFKGINSIDGYIAMKARLDQDRVESGIDTSIWQSPSVPASRPGGVSGGETLVSTRSLSPLFVFVSHTYEHRVEVSELSSNLNPFGFECFVAHEMIEPTAEWQTEIETALRRCDSLIAYITANFHTSSWTDQEVGWVLGRGRPVVAVQSPNAPYGFIGRFQGLSAARSSTPSALAYEVGRALVNTTVASRDDGLIERLTEQVINSFCGSPSFESTTRLLGLLRMTPGRFWSSERVNRLTSAASSNSQITEAVDQCVAVPTLLHRLIEEKAQAD